MTVNKTNTMFIVPGTCVTSYGVRALLILDFQLFKFSSHFIVTWHVTIQTLLHN